MCIVPNQNSRPTMSEWVNIALRRFLHNHGNIATEGSPKSGLCPTLIEWSRVLYSAQYHRKYCTLQARQFGALYFCIGTISITNIRPDRDSNSVPLSFEPQPDRMRHRGRPTMNPVGTRRCCDAESTSLTSILRRNNVVCPVGTHQYEWHTSHRTPYWFFLVKVNVFYNRHTLVGNYKPTIRYYCISEKWT